MFNLAEFSCRHHFDVRFSLIADICQTFVRFVPEADSESIRLPVSDRRKNCHACPQRVKDYQVVSKMAV